MESRFNDILNKSRLSYVGKSTLLFSSIMLFSYIVICTCLGKNILLNNYIYIKTILVIFTNFTFFNLEYEFAKIVNNRKINNYFIIGIIFIILYGILEFAIPFFILLWKTFIYQSMGFWLFIILTGGFILGLIMYLYDIKV